MGGTGLSDRPLSRCVISTIRHRAAVAASAALAAALRLLSALRCAVIFGYYHSIYFISSARLYICTRRRNPAPRRSARGGDGGSAQSTTDSGARSVQPHSRWSATDVILWTREDAYTPTFGMGNQAYIFRLSKTKITAKPVCGYIGHFSFFMTATLWT